MKRLSVLALIIMTSVSFWSCTSKQEKMETRMKDFITAYELKIKPLYKDVNLTSWNANVTGSDADWALSEKASFNYAKVFTDTKAFAELKELKESGEVKDSLLSRQLTLLYNLYLGGQVDTSLISQQIKMETAINKKILKLPSKFKW